MSCTNASAFRVRANAQPSDGVKVVGAVTELGISDVAHLAVVLATDGAPGAPVPAVVVEGGAALSAGKP